MNMSRPCFSPPRQSIAGRRSNRGTRSGIAAVEFALMTPFLAAMLVIIVDIGRFVYYHSIILGAVSAGAEFAFLAAQHGTAIATVSSEAATVTQTQSQGWLTASNVTVTVNNGTSSSNLCCIQTSGTTTTWTCAAAPTCSDGSNPGLYIKIVGSATFQPLLSADTKLVGSAMTSTVIKRLK